MEQVLERAAELGVAMEINCQPDRLDLSDVNARLAKEKGVTLVIDTDAHSIANLDLMRYGLFVARRAGLTKDDVLNTLALRAHAQGDPQGPRPRGEGGSREGRGETEDRQEAMSPARGRRR